MSASDDFAYSAWVAKRLMFGFVFLFLLNCRLFLLALLNVVAEETFADVELHATS